MKLKVITTFLILIVTLSLYGQGNQEKQINRIDSIVTSIPSEFKNNEEYSNIESSGLIHKRIFGIFKKQIGSVSGETIHSDSLILCVSNYYRYRKHQKWITEKFYYENNQLIKYNKVLSIFVESEKHRQEIQRIDAYFNKNEMIYKTKKIKDDYVFSNSEVCKIQSVAQIEIHNTIETIRTYENYPRKYLELKEKKEK